MATARTGTILMALRDSLLLRPALVGVEVMVVRPGDLPRNDVIVLLIPADEPLPRSGEWAAMGRRRHTDDLRLRGRVASYRTAATADAAVIGALDRCDELIGEVFAQLKEAPPQVGDQTIEAIVSDRSYPVTASDKGGWWAICDFTVTLSGRSS